MSVVVSVQPLVGASMTAYSSAESPTIESDRTDRIEAWRGRVLRVGDEEHAGDRPTITIGRFTRKTEPQ